MMNSESFDSSELPASSSSTTENAPNSNSDKAEGSNLKLFDDAYKFILDELIDDAMWELCFEVHKAVKTGNFYNFFSDDEKRKHRDAEKDIFGHDLKSKVPPTQISCQNCMKKSCVTKFASHLAKCRGMNGRNSSRAANKKVAAANLHGSDLDENDFDGDTSSTNKKRFKKSQPKKISRKKSKGQEKRKAAVNQMCGVMRVMHLDEQHNQTYSFEGYGGSVKK